MSCSRGNTNRNRPQKHQNKTAFKNNLHDTSKKTKIINNLEVTGVCERCKEIIEWKIKFKKYKTLNAPSKCVGCEHKSVKYAYHILCTLCATEKNVCSKCCKPFNVMKKSTEENMENADNKYQSVLKSLPERKRRTLLRYIKKQQDGQDITNSKIEALLSEIDKIDLDDDDFNNWLDEDNQSEPES